MALIESVAVRQRGSVDFESYYNNLCALQNSCPLPAVKSQLQEKIIDLNGDRIRATDWNPILGTLKINKTLEHVSVRSYYQQTVEEQEKRGYTVKRKVPAIRSKEITYRLCKVLKECLAVSSVLTSIDLHGLPLRTRDLAALAKGLMANKSLKSVSLNYSRIGDEGLEILCKGIKNCSSLSQLDFTGCSLSWKGIDHLAKLIKLLISKIDFQLARRNILQPENLKLHGDFWQLHQAMKRHNEAWQDSLRYRRPELDRMEGIRRISINRNPMVADEGARYLAEALKDDLWLKALDLQHCGLSDQGAKHLVDVLKYNTCLVVLDVRNNPMIAQDVVRNIMDHLMINSNGQETQYKWLNSELPQDPNKARQRKKRTKTLQSNFGRKTTIKVSNSGRKRTKSTGTPGKPSTEAVTPGIPWRTALRANRYKGYPPDDSPDKSVGRYEGGVGSSPPGGERLAYKIEYSYEDEEGGDSTKAVGVGSDTDTDVTDPRGVRVEIERLRRRVKEETKARSKTDERVIELTVENNHLKQQIDDFRSRQSILDDDRVLESLEQSFRQFHSFLDLLRDAGLGQLISLAGIDQNSMPFSKDSPSTPSHMRKSALQNHHYNISGSRIQIQDPGTYHQSAPDLSSQSDLPRHQQQQAKSSQPKKPTATTANTSGKSRSDTALNGRNNKVAFPQLKPQNYQNASDPTMQSTPAVTNNNGKSKSKFDELFQKVMEETNGALSDSMNKASEPNGLYQRGSVKGGVKLDREKRGNRGGSGDDLSEGSDRSGRPLLMEDLRDFEDLELAPTSSDPTTQVRRGPAHRNDNHSATTPRDAEHTTTSAKYSETFERDDSEPSDIREEILSLHSDF